MKIFNWVHRKFSNKGEYSKNRNGSIHIISSVINEENHYYDFDLHDDGDGDVENINTSNNYFKYHVCDQHWSSGGGILAVGTLGHDDPLIIKDRHVLMSSFYEEEDGDDDHFEEEEKEKEDFNNNSKKKNSYKRSMRRRRRKDRFMTDEFDCHDQTYLMMEKKERITLGDLLSHDDDELKLKPINTTTNISSTTSINYAVTIDKLLASNYYYYLHCNKNDGRNNNNNKKKKKKKHIAEDDARPIGKLQQMMRRMFKRKIHPDCIDSKRMMMVMRNWDTTNNEYYASLQ